MGKKYSKEFIKSVLQNKGYEVIGEINTSNDKVLCKTQDGYLITPTPSGVIRRGDSSEIFSKYNPYTIENIKLWLRNNNITSIELLSNEYKNSASNLRWLCLNCGNEFETSWNTISQGKKYCNFCSKSKRYDGLKDYTSEIQAECSKRGYSLLSESINRSSDDFQYICNKHSDKGIQYSTYDMFVNRKEGCKYCGIERRGKNRRLKVSKIKSLVESKGFIFCGVNYNYGDSSRKKVRIEILCPRHKQKGVQIVSYDNLLRSNGRCKYCAGRGRTKDDLQSELNEINLKVTILNYTSYSEPINVKCDICGYEWTSLGVNLTQGHRCPNCNKSKFEIDVQSILDKHNIDYQTQYRFDECKDKLTLPFDFYLSDKNILIEADGEGHYMPIRRTSSMTHQEAVELLQLVQYHDKIKTDFCLNNNIKLIRIPYWERNNLENFILNKIN